MIISLLRAGKKVGITANSHKVISNLLGEIYSEEHSGGDVHAIQKYKLDHCDHDNVILTQSNDAARAALADNKVQVVAGTPWLFARSEFEQSLDVLFIDRVNQLGAAAEVVAESEPLHRQRDDGGSDQEEHQGDLALGILDHGRSVR